MFKVGDIVKIRKNSRYYGTDQRTNPADVEGEVTGIRADKSYVVTWPSFFTNCYEAYDLELADGMLSSLHDGVTSRDNLLLCNTRHLEWGYNSKTSTLSVKLPSTAGRMNVCKKGEIHNVIAALLALAGEIEDE